LLLPCFSCARTGTANVNDNAHNPISTFIETSKNILHHVAGFGEYPWVSIGTVVVGRYG
jgi:hypothetical protein